MERHVFFKNKVDGRYGGVVLKAIRAFGPNREEINAMTIDQRLELLQQKAAERGGVWQRVFGKDGRMVFFTTAGWSGFHSSIPLNIRMWMTSISLNDLKRGDKSYA